eukprot:6210077-Pleurochrysis_carterae.AAC.4
MAWLDQLARLRGERLSSLHAALALLAAKLVRARASLCSRRLPAARARCMRWARSLADGTLQAGAPLCSPPMGPPATEPPISSCMSQSAASSCNLLSLGAGLCWSVDSWLIDVISHSCCASNGVRAVLREISWTGVISPSRSFLARARASVANSSAFSLMRRLRTSSSPKALCALSMEMSAATSRTAASEREAALQRGVGRRADREPMPGSELSPPSARGDATDAADALGADNSETLGLALALDMLYLSSSDLCLG